MKFIIYNCLFNEEEATKLVRPLYLKNGNPIEIYDNQFINCFFNGDGNVIKTENNVQKLILHDCKFINCGNQGHAVLFQGSNCEIEK